MAHVTQQRACKRSPALGIVAAVLVAAVACGSGTPGGMQSTWSCPSQPPSASYFTGAWPDSVAVADLNGDGKKDLAVANWGSATVSVLLGAGDGTFGTAVDYATDASVVGGGSCAAGAGAVCTAAFVVVGDFNGDGKPDLAVANTGGQSISVFLGNGDGTFQQRVDYRTNGQPSSLAVADFDGDGASDLAVTSVVLSAGGQAAFASIDVIFGDRGGTLKTSANHLGAILVPAFVVAADFNADGKADLAVTNPSTNAVSVFLGEGNGTFLPSVDYAVAQSPSYVTVGDFNGDGHADLAVVSSATSTISVLLARPDGTFQPKVDYVMYATETISVATGDFNGDHRLDLVVGLASTDSVVVLLGRGDGTFEGPAAYGAGVNPLSLAAGDFNGDGRDDLAVAGACATAMCDSAANDTVATFLSCSR